MQSHQRIEGGPEQAGADGQPLVVDQVVPLASGAQDEDRSQRDREQPPNPEQPALTARNGAFRHHDREAAGEQADRVEDRNVKYFAWRGAVQALSRVVQVGNHEDAEDRGLSRNQHHMPTCPRHSCASGISDCGIAIVVAAKCKSPFGPVYSYFQSGSSGCFKSHSGRRLCTTGILAKL